MKIYVASSWKNAHQQKVVEVLRSAGHEVYDFRKPRAGNDGFSWQQVDPTYQRGLHVPAEHWRRLVDHPVALEGHALDLGAMKWADACVYVLPCGRSASFEAGWFAGQGKKLVVLAFEPTEPELMFREADIVGSLAGMLDALATPSPETGALPPCYCASPNGTLHDIACPSHPDADPAAEPGAKLYENAQEIRRRAQGPDLTVEDIQAAAEPGRPATCGECGGWGWHGNNARSPRGCSACLGTGRTTPEEGGR